MSRGHVKVKVRVGLFWRHGVGEGAGQGQGYMVYGLVWRPGSGLCGLWFSIKVRVIPFSARMEGEDEGLG